MSLIRNIPLRLLIPLFIFVGFFSFNIYQYYTERTKTLAIIKESFLINARVMGDGLQQMVEYFWVRQDTGSISKVVSSYSAHLNVDKIIFMDASGKVIVASKKELEGSMWKYNSNIYGCVSENESVVCSFKVSGNGKEKAQLMIYFDFSEEINKISTVMLEKMMGQILFFGFIAIILYFVLQELIIKELYKIAIFIKTSQKGVTRTGLEVKGKNELETIKKGVNEAWETIWHLINMDYLTGIYNRRYLEAVYENDLKNQNLPVFMAMIDIDNFKNINDIFGHDTGDTLLKALADRLRKYAEDNGFYAGRFGGDEFIIMGTFEKEDQITATFQKVRKIISSKYEVHDVEFFITVSVGYSLTGSEHKPSFYHLLKECDIALYRGKETTKDTIVSFSKQQEEREKKKREILLQIKRGMENQEFYLVYQGIYEIEKSETIAYEALLRWQNQILGSVPPAEFIPYAEVSGYILELGRYVISRAIASIPLLKKPVHINLSARQFYDKGLIEFIDSECRKSGVPKEYLVLEITETQNVMLDEYIISQIKKLIREGYRISLDDFGTGYSNIILLSELKPDIIKIDMSIIKRVDTDEHAAKIVEAIVEMADTFGINVVAEGVDSESKVNRLRQLGVKTVQGFYFEKPRPLEEILSLSKSS